MHACVSRKMGEATEDLYILVSAKFDDFPGGFWCGPCGSACLVIPPGVSVAANFSVFYLDSHLLPLEKSPVIWQRDTTN